MLISEGQIYNVSVFVQAEVLGVSGQIKPLKAFQMSLDV